MHGTEVAVQLIFLQQTFLLSITIFCFTGIYAQSSKEKIHNALFDELHKSTIVQNAKEWEAFPILKNTNPCLIIDCDLFSEENEKRFLIWTAEDMFMRSLKNYIIIDEIDYKLKTLKVRVKFQGEMIDKNPANFKKVTIQL